MESIHLVPVKPVRPVAGYIGGKRILAARLAEKISEIPHNTYVEPFVGMGGVFLRRGLRPRAEVINDVSRDVTTLFRILQRHYQQFLDVLKWQLASRAEFERLLGVDPASLTDLERAARFLSLQRLTFGGKVMGRNFGVDPSSPARWDLTKLVPILEDVHERLSGVVIERLPYHQLIPRYDRPGTLFYLDPPYWGCETDYGKNVFERSDFERLRDLLSNLKGRFILSLNDTPEVREIFSDFQMDSVALHYSVGSAPKAVKEVIIEG